MLDLVPRALRYIRYGVFPNNGVADLWFAVAGKKKFVTYLRGWAESLKPDWPVRSVSETICAN